MSLQFSELSVLLEAINIFIGQWYHSHKQQFFGAPVNGA